MLCTRTIWRITHGGRIKTDWRTETRVLFYAGWTIALYCNEYVKLLLKTQIIAIGCQHNEQQFSLGQVILILKEIFGLRYGRMDMFDTDAILMELQMSWVS